MPSNGQIGFPSRQISRHNSLVREHLNVEKRRRERVMLIESVCFSFWFLLPSLFLPFIGERDNHPQASYLFVNHNQGSSHCPVFFRYFCVAQVCPCDCLSLQLLLDRLMWLTVIISEAHIIRVGNCQCATLSLLFRLRCPRDGRWYDLSLVLLET